MLLIGSNWGIRFGIQGPGPKLWLINFFESRIRVNCEVMLPEEIAISSFAKEGLKYLRGTLV